MAFVALTGWPGQAACSRGLVICPVCSCLQVTPEVPVRAEQSACTWRRRQLLSPAGAGLGPGRCTPVRPPPPRWSSSWSFRAPTHPHTCPHTGSWARPVRRGQKPFKVGANVTKCFPSRGRRTWRSQIRPCADVLPCFTSSSPAEAGPGVIQAVWGRKTRHRGVKPLAEYEQ